MAQPLNEHSPSEDEQVQFDENLASARKYEVPAEALVGPDGYKTGWEPQDGSQKRFLQSPYFETLFHGTRGPGKTDALIWAFAQEVGKGYGAAWRGIIFRQTYPQLADVVAKTEKWFKLIFGNKAKFNRAKMMWEFSTGEALLLRHMNKPADYWNYHGHEYPFIGFEELTNWPDDQCYKSMFSCCRCSTPGVPRMVRATTNPYGPGHGWVKERFQLAGQWWTTVRLKAPVDAEGRVERPRMAIYGHIKENKILLSADPDYMKTIISSAANPEMIKAWLSGSWDIVSGGMFGDVWRAEYNIITPFTLPPTWRIDRSFDWGSSKPFSVGWWAESDGCDIMVDGQWRSTVRGDLFRIYEWYGFTGKPNQGKQMLATDVAKGIIEYELAWGIYGKVKAGPADSSIYDVENGASIGLDMAKPVRIGKDMYKGVQWTRADKRPGSRIAGWEAVRTMMKAAHPNEYGPRENPGLFVFDRCGQFIRTVPSLPRDEKIMDDVDTDSEDHIGDETRYKVRSTFQKSSSGSMIGR